MTTTTKSPAAELAKLTAARDKAHAAVRAEVKKRDTYHAETRGLIASLTVHRGEHPDQYAAGGAPLAGTEARKLADEIGRRTGGNPLAPIADSAVPNQEKLDAARAAFAEADTRLQEFRREHMSDLLGELRPEFDVARDKIREGFALVLEGAEGYASVAGQTRELIVACPGIDGQALVADGRPAEWAILAAAVLEADELAPPGINELATWTLENGSHE